MNIEIALEKFEDNNILSQIERMSSQDFDVEIEVIMSIYKYAKKKFEKSLKEKK